jgi:hypothetical protein
MFRRLLIYKVLAGLPILFIGALLCVLEINRVAGLCSKAKSPVSNSHEALDAIRNDPAWPFLSHSSSLLLSKIFNNDGHDKEGGWRVQQWTELGLIHGYAVDFEQAKPEFEIACDAIHAEQCTTAARSEQQTTEIIT